MQILLIFTEFLIIIGILYVICMNIICIFKIIPIHITVNILTQIINSLQSSTFLHLIYQC